MQHFESWMASELGRGIILVVAIIILALVLILIKRFVLHRAVKKAEGTKLLIAQAVVIALTKPLNWMFLSLALILAARTLMSTFLEVHIDKSLMIIFRLTLIFYLGWAFIRLNRGLIQAYLKLHSSTSGSGGIRFVRWGIDALVMFFGVDLFLVSLGIPINAGLAVLGGSVGLIAIALKDLITPFVSDIFFALNPPFRVGASIEAIQGAVKGKVVSISWRLTRVEKENGEIDSVPNSLLLTSIVTNKK